MRRHQEGMVCHGKTGDNVIWHDGGRNRLYKKEVTRRENVRWDGTKGHEMIGTDAIVSDTIIRARKTGSGVAVWESEGGGIT